MAGKKHSRKKEKAHDAVFKAFFSDVKIVKNYLLDFTPPEVHQHIDFSFLRKCDTAFVSGRFGISFSDVLYETRLVNAAVARLLFYLSIKVIYPHNRSACNCWINCCKFGKMI